MKTIIFICSMLLLTSACATPVPYSSRPYEPYDKDTQYNVEETGKGFVVNIIYERWQVISEALALTTACKSHLLSIAYEHADKRGKKIHPVNEQRVKLSVGRNILTGVSSCSATVQAEYQ